MKICLYGAGAIGGLLGVRLAHKGAEVSVIEVGPTLEAIQKHGLRVQENGEMVSAPVTATSDPSTLGPQDLVIVAVKGPTLKFIAPKIGPLLGPETVIMTAMNGVPWWFFHGFGGEYSRAQLQSVDPGGKIDAQIPADRIIGCVIMLSCRLIEPGVVEHVSGNKLTIGEPDNSISLRVGALGTLLTAAGFNVSVSPSIQKEIWLKLLGNMTHNPISALTGATLDRILDDPFVSDLCIKIMYEAAAVGKKFGCVMTDTPEQRNESTRSLGAFKTSMLQDVEAKKAVELDALVGAVSEIAVKVGVPTPYTDALLGLARVQAQVLGLYPETSASTQTHAVASGK
jgi:2-dehydropantoate 2-reductase